MDWAELWRKTRWFLAALAAGLVWWIDPKRIDDLASQHPHFGGLILAVWGILLAWAGKRGIPSEKK